MSKLIKRTVWLPALIILGCGQVVTDAPETSDTSEPIMNLKSTGVMFTGEEDHAITPDHAAQMTSKFQENNPFDTHAWFFSKKSFEKLLATSGSVGIRIYGGRKQDGQFTLVAYSVSAQGVDLYDRGLSKTTIDSTRFQTPPINEPFPCPPYCGP